MTDLRADCCADWPKPCEYHACWTEALDTIGDDLGSLATAGVRYALSRRNHLEPASTLDVLTRLWDHLPDGAQDIVWRDVARAWATTSPHGDEQAPRLARWLRLHDTSEAARRWHRVGQAALNDGQQRDLTVVLAGSEATDA